MYDRDEVAAQIENIENLNDRMREMGEFFDTIRGKFTGDEQSSPVGENYRGGAGFDVEAVAKFTQSLLTASDATDKLSRQFDSFAERLSQVITEQDNVKRALPGASTGTDMVPVNVGVPRPPESQVTTYGSGGAMPIMPTRANLPDDMYSPIRNYKEAEKWFIDSQRGEHGIAGAYLNLQKKLDVDIQQYLPLAMAGFDPKLIGKIADKDAKDNFLQWAQQQTAVRVQPKPPKIKQQPRPSYKINWPRVRAQALKGAFWGGTTGGLRGIARGAMTGAGTAMFNNPYFVATAAAAAIPLVLSQTVAMADRQLDTNRRYAAFAPDAFNAIVDYDIHNMQRSISLAQATSGTTAALARQQDRTRDAMQPYERFTGNLGNVVSTGLSGFAEGAMNRMASMFNTMNDTIGTQEFGENAAGLGRAMGGAAIDAGKVAILTAPLNFIPGVGTGLWLTATLGAGAISFMKNLFAEERAEPSKIAPLLEPERLNFGAGAMNKVAPRPRAF